MCVFAIRERERVETNKLNDIAFGLSWVILLCAMLDHARESETHNLDRYALTRWLKRNHKS